MKRVPFSLSSYIRYIAKPYFPQLGIETDCLARLAQLSRLFSRKAEYLMLEMPLSQEKWIDLSICSKKVKNLIPTKKSLSRHKLWEKVIPYFQSCSYFPDGIWIEFDLGSNKEWPPAPNLFLGKPQNDFDFSNAFSYFFGRPLSPAALQIIQNSYQGLFKPFRTGFMLARKDIFRLCAKSNATHSLSEYTSYLLHLGIDYFCQKTLTLIERLIPYVAQVSFELNVGEKRVLPQVGWNLYIKKKENGKKALEFLAQEGAIDTQKKNILLSWAGNGPVGFDPVIKSTFSHEKTWILHSISHIKLTQNVNSSPLIKIYLTAAGIKESYI